MSSSKGILDKTNLGSRQKVIEYLSKKGYSKTEAMLRRESETTDREGRPLITRAEDLGGDKYKSGFSMCSSSVCLLSRRLVSCVLKDHH